MADRPIIFSAPMIRALFDGRKTQTRRIINPQPQLNDAGLWRYPPDSACGGDPTKWFKKFGGFCQTDDEGLREFLSCQSCRLPYAPGDRLWVREAHALVPSTAYRMSEGVVQAIDPEDRDRACIYREGWERSAGGLRWRPSIHMPRWASRLTLTVTEVRVQRLQDISEADAVAEGAMAKYGEGAAISHKRAFNLIWNSLHGPDAWDKNPWVVALTFSVEQRNIDEVPHA